MRRKEIWSKSEYETSRLLPNFWHALAARRQVFTGKRSIEETLTKVKGALGSTLLMDAA